MCSDQRRTLLLSADIDTVRYLMELAMTGGDLFECLGQSHTAVAGWILAFAYFTTTGLLLLNMLIAMMAKTFESISECALDS